MPKEVTVVEHRSPVKTSYHCSFCKGYSEETYQIWLDDDDMFRICESCRSKIASYQGRDFTRWEYDDVERDEEYMRQYHARKRAERQAEQQRIKDLIVRMESLKSELEAVTEEISERYEAEFDDEE